jgi:hypothetical protein
MIFDRFRDRSARCFNFSLPEFGLKQDLKNQQVFKPNQFCQDLFLPVLWRITISLSEHNGKKAQIELSSAVLPKVFIFNGLVKTKK